MSNLERKLALLLEELGFYVCAWNDEDPRINTFFLEFPVNSYKLDFACPYCKIAIEVDGYWHHRTGQKIKDFTKTITLNKAGWRILRLSERDMTNSRLCEKVDYWLNRELYY